MTVSLLRRFPKLRTPTDSWPVIPPGKRSEYPALAEDFQAIDRELTPHYIEHDKAALRNQHHYRSQQVFIVLGSALVTGLGGLQAVFPDQRWPGVLLAVLSIMLVTSSQFAKERASLTDYLSDRVKAERLRALHFRYLSRADPFADADRELALRRAVRAIRAGKEPE
jgi:SMODS and SLOG-associating 2TM effector domain 3